MRETGTVLVERTSSGVAIVRLNRPTQSWTQRPDGG